MSKKKRNKLNPKSGHDTDTPEPQGKALPRPSTPPRETQPAPTQDDAFSKALSLLSCWDVTDKEYSTAPFVSAVVFVNRNCVKELDGYKENQATVLHTPNVVANMVAMLKDRLLASQFKDVQVVINALCSLVYHCDDAAQLTTSECPVLPALKDVLVHRNQKARKLDQSVWEFLEATSYTQSTHPAILDLDFTQLAVNTLESKKPPLPNAKTQRAISHLFLRMCCNRKVNKRLEPFVPFLTKQMNVGRANSGAIGASLAVANLIGHREKDVDLLQVKSQLVTNITRAYRSTLTGAKDFKSGVLWDLAELTRGVNNLALNDSNKQMLHENGMVQLLLDGLRQASHDHQARLQEECTGALWTLSFNEACQQVLTADEHAMQLIGQVRATGLSKIAQNNAAGILFVLNPERPTQPPAEPKSRFTIRKQKHKLRKGSSSSEILRTHSLPLSSTRKSDVGKSPTGGGSCFSLKEGQPVVEDSASVVSTPTMLADTGKPASLHRIKSLASAGRLPRSPSESAEPDMVMISYCWANQATAIQVKELLHQVGFKTWMDIDNMAGSTLEAMAKAVEDAKIILVCFSEAYQQSQACRTEAEYAYKLKKMLVPLKMENYDPDGWLGALLGTRLWFDCYSQPPSEKIDAIAKEILSHGVFAEHQLRYLGEQSDDFDDECDDSSVFSSVTTTPVLKRNSSVSLAPMTPAVSTPVVAHEKPVPVAVRPSVPDWLHEMGFQEYQDAFELHDMDWEALAYLGKLEHKQADVLLKEEIGVSKLGHRLKLWHRLQSRLADQT